MWILGLMVVFVSCCLKDAAVGLLGWFMLVSGCWLPFLCCVFWSGVLVDLPVFCGLLWGWCNTDCAS